MNYRYCQFRKQNREFFSQEQQRRIFPAWKTLRVGDLTIFTSKFLNLNIHNKSHTKKTVFQFNNLKISMQNIISNDLCLIDKCRGQSHHSITLGPGDI